MDYEVVEGVDLVIFIVWGFIFNGGCGGSGCCFFNVISDFFGFFWVVK